MTNSWSMAFASLVNILACFHPLCDNFHMPCHDHLIMKNVENIPCLASNMSYICSTCCVSCRHGSIIHCSCNVPFSICFGDNALCDAPSMKNNFSFHHFGCNYIDALDMHCLECYPITPFVASSMMKHLSSHCLACNNC